ncbi:MAG TPA: hypothetical protein VFW66_11690 [Gemmatimonadales bacterium]|nr:hypothetical protein [Gemmatimonadales bacterium]
MAVAADVITFETRVHLRWQIGDAVEAALWRNAAELAGGRAVHLYHHEDGSGYTLTIEASVRDALTNLRYTPHRLADMAFEGTEPQVRRLQELYWALWLPRHSPTGVTLN